MTRPSSVEILTRSGPLKPMFLPMENGTAACGRNVGQHRLIPFVRFDHLRNAANRRIRRQPKALPAARSRCSFCNAILLAHCCAKAIPASQVAASLKRSTVVRSASACDGIGQELELQGQFHANSYIGIISQCQMPTRVGRRH